MGPSDKPLLAHYHTQYQLGLVIVLACGGEAIITEEVCPQTQMQCGAICATLATDVANCGTCGNACGSSQTCIGGACSAPCSGDTSVCVGDDGAYCTKLDSDNDNCGSCGDACASGNVCSLGTCNPTCLDGLTFCVKGCIDTMTDRANCGKLWSKMHRRLCWWAL